MRTSLRRLKSRPLLSLLLSMLLAVLAAAVAFGVAKRVQYERRLQRHIEDVRSGPEREQQPVTPSDYADLPDPVRRYLSFAIEDGHPSVRTVRLEQRGSFRLGGADSRWYPLKSTQYVSTDPPGFVWDATISILGAVPIRVLDTYERGRGRLEARAFSAIPVAAMGPGPDMDEAELERYLAETPWYPTALLPGAGVEWSAIDDETARATLDDGSVTASLVFHFDDDGRIDRVTTGRYHQERDEHVPWTGHFGAYETRDGMRIPVEGTVEWNLEDGDVPYGRFTITDIEYFS